MQPQQIHPQRLFAGSCFALVSTSVAFGVITSNMDQFKEHFTLSNTQAGWIGGVTLWGFTLSIFALGPLVDAMGIKLQMRIAMLCHALGVLLMVAAGEMPQPDSAMAFGALFAGGLFIALGNGTVEAACNPLVATLYPDNKTTKLNQFHVWFPGGIVIGGLIAFLLDNTLFKGGGQVAGLSAWQVKLLVVLIPTVIYGILFLGQSFPRTERVESGVTFGQMFQAALKPLFILMLLCMCLTASLELGPGRWMGTAMNEVMAWAGDNAGILVLVYGTGLMAVLRFFAGPVVHRLAPTGVLLMSAVLAGLGLYLLSLVDAAALVFLAATVFFVGVCYFWPTMLGFVAERLPRTGALGLALMGGTGMACVGLVTAPLMGAIGDEYVHRELVDRQAQVAQVLQASALPEAEVVQQELATSGALPKGATADAIRSVIKAKESEALVADARAIIEPADAHGMRWGFRWTAVGAIPLVIIFGALFAYYRGRGGYKAERLGVQTPEAIPAAGAAD
ncbi:MAG: MFS transporter [Phycisphaerales bacterium JB039]